MSVLNTSVSGMLADSNWLSTIAQNVSNANTTGYKNTETEFSSLIAGAPGQTPQMAGVSTKMVAYNDMQGPVSATQTVTNIAVQGAGFFMVSDSTGSMFLTRNGSFTPDASGNLVNSAGYYLMAAPTTTATAASQSVNSVSGLTKVVVNGAAASAAPSTAAALTVNLPSTASTIAAANLPSTNTATSQYSDETTITAYDNLGGAHTLNLYFSNTGSGAWEVDAFDASTAAASGGFPYSSGPLATGTLAFNTTTGALSSGSPLTLTVPGGQTLTIDLSKATQLATKFGITSSTIDGNAPGSMTGVSISQSGILSYQYSNNASSDAYIIPLANVASPDNLSSVLGGAFQTNSSSGPLQLNNPNTAGLGTINSSSIEGSTVDLATEITNMIQAQSAYTANSKVFQTGTNIFEVLNNLKA
jgi:flagellar hook protein FlgE